MELREIERLLAALKAEHVATQLAVAALFDELLERDVEAAELAARRLAGFAAMPLPPGCAAQVETLAAEWRRLVKDQREQDD